MGTKMIRRLALLLSLALAVVVLAPAGASAGPHHRSKAAACSASHASVERGAIRKARRATLCLLNRARARAGLRPLRLNRRLSRVAGRHSRTMVRRSYFSHASPNGSSPFDRILRSGYARNASSWRLAENIGWGSAAKSRPAALVRMWMHSPGHRANILSPTYREIGIGIAVGLPVGRAHASRGADGATYTTDFGSHS
jgi:uncharacterized protein YkwD